MEIERKFLVKSLPEDINSFPHKQISQGYISDINPSIRIRQLDDKYILTIKSGVFTLHTYFFYLLILVIFINFLFKIYTK